MKTLTLWFLLAMLSACGGGGGGGGNTENATPSANAGADQRVNVNTRVALNGSASSGGDGALAYRWVQRSGANTVVVSGANTATASFTSPAGADTLVFELTVNDADGDRDTDTVTVTVEQNTAPLADAGADQTIDETASVILNGLASRDNDGEIKSYRWVQQSGPAVSLINANQVQARFAAPEIDGPSTTAATLVFQLTVEDDDGATSTDTVAVTVNNSLVTLSGTVRFEEVTLGARGRGLDYDRAVYKPLRGVTARVLNGAGVQDQVVTDENGRFTLRLPSNSTTQNPQFLAELKNPAGSAAVWDVTVLNNTNANALYSVQFLIGNTGYSNRDIGNLDIASGWSTTSNAYTAPRNAAPFAILDAIYDAMHDTIAVDNDVVFPPLKVLWYEDNASCSGDLSVGCIGTSHYRSNIAEMYVLGKQDEDTDEYDSHVVIHEWGHYFEDQLSRSDSIGGSHSLSESLDMRLAFGEGFGNALSGIVTDDPVYRDSFGASQNADFEVNVERNDSSGWFNEATVQSLLYDLYDDTADASEDVLALGWRPLYETLVSAPYRNHPAMISAFAFLEQLKANNAGLMSAISDLAQQRGINGSNGFGEGETNSSSASNPSDVLPVYTTLTAGAASRVCTHSEFGTPNKLANRRFLSFTPATTGAHRIQISALDNGSDFDALVYQAGTLIAFLSAVGDESRLVNLIAGRTVILEVYDDNLIKGGVSGQRCVDVGVTPT